MIEIDNEDCIISDVGNVLYVDLKYPKINRINTIELGQMSVRASDGIRVSYDYDRDGWIVAQPAPPGDDDEPVWQEVCFVKSWALYPPDYEDKSK